LDAWEEPSWQAKLVKLVDGLFNKKTPADTLAKIIINFGDSEAVELSDLQGGVSHTYTCDRQLCIFTATIQAVTGSGITSTLERQSRIQIEVQGQ
jgi:hypothetical protein